MKGWLTDSVAVGDETPTSRMDGKFPRGRAAELSSRRGGGVGRIMQTAEIEGDPLQRPATLVNRKRVCARATRKPAYARRCINGRFASMGFPSR